MYLQKIKLENYRNIGHAEVDFSTPLTILVGQNGMGKTNVLEAIHLLSFPRSFRRTKDALLPSWQADFCRVEGTMHTTETGLDQSIVYFYSGQKKLMIDGQAVAATDYVGNFLSVLFSPEEVGLLTDSPASRRAFLDAHLSQLSRSYFFHLLHYGKVLKQRNKLLSKKSLTKGELDYWNEQQIVHGSVVMSSRIEAIERFNARLKGGLKVVYKPSFTFEPERLVDDFQYKQTSISEREMMVGHSLVGPHRDDWQLMEAGEGERDLGVYGSRGEQRMAVIRLKQTESEIIFEIKGQRPVLLLDDVLSELDAGRQQELVRGIKEQQTVLTTASLSDIPQELLETATVYEVDGGVLKLVD